MKRPVVRNHRDGGRLAVAACASAFVFFLSPFAQAQRNLAPGLIAIYVDVDNCPAGDGSIGNPYCTIQEAIDDPTPGVDEIIVAQGIYLENIDLDGRAVRLRSTDPTNPAIVANTIIDASGFGHVVACESGEGPDTIIDGFTIRGGGSVGSGGGVWIVSSSPTISNCRITANDANSGGGLWVGSGSPSVMTCTFEGNTSSGVAGMGMTGGSEALIVGCVFMANDGDPATGTGALEGDGATVRDSLFIDNSGPGGGGYCGGNSTFTNCRFINNYSAFNGGAMAIRNNIEPTTLDNCVFIANTGDAGGGAVYVSVMNHVRAFNCTFIGNDGGSGPLGGGGVFVNSNASAWISNSILWGNTGTDGLLEQIRPWDGTSSTVVSYSDVHLGWPGIGNISAAPQLADADGADDILGTFDDDVRLAAGSPAIDAGDSGAAPGFADT